MGRPKLELLASNGVHIRHAKKLCLNIHTHILLESWQLHGEVH